LPRSFPSKGNLHWISVFPEFTEALAVALLTTIKALLLFFGKANVA